MFDALTADALTPPPAYIAPAKKRGRRSSTTRTKRATAYAIGAWLLLSDGRRCQVWQDESGVYWCQPEDAPAAHSLRLAE